MGRGGTKSAYRTMIRRGLRKEPEKSLPEEYHRGKRVTVVGLDSYVIGTVGSVRYANKEILLRIVVADQNKVIEVPSDRVLPYMPYWKWYIGNRFNIIIPTWNFYQSLQNLKAWILKTLPRQITTKLKKQDRAKRKGS